MLKRLRDQTRGITTHLVKPKRLAIFEAFIIGIVSGLAGVFLKTGIGWLGKWRVEASFLFPTAFILPAIGVIGGGVAGLLVICLAPESAGSGIPQVKAALAGVKMPLNLRVAIVKLITTILTVASGFTLGRQGPTVQIGAAFAAWIGRLVPTSPDYRRRLIACGAAAGLAAGFNAPIAGVLFVVEELLHDLSSLTLNTALIASFTGAVVSQLLSGDSLSLGHRVEHISFAAQEIPFFVLLGILAGVLGAIFSRGIVISNQFHRQFLRVGLPVRMALAGLICGCVMAMLPATFRDHASLREFILTRGAQWQTFAIAFIVHFGLTINAAGSGAPGGLFAPSLILGAALGQTVGSLETTVLMISNPETFALAGMGAFFCAVSRVPITAVVIVFELTQDFKLVLPLMICSAFAYLVAEKLDQDSLYDQLLELNGIHLPKERSNNELLNNLCAADVMQRHVESLDSQMTLHEVRQAFVHSHHQGFPVVETDGKLVGIITQTDLTQTRRRRMPKDTPLYRFMTPQPVGVNPQDTLSEVLYRLGRYQLSRLPVTEGRKLVGIITRSDIIRAESDHLCGSTAEATPRANPSYVVYQTRSPAIGKGRLLVPLSNPKTAPILLELAIAIARQRHYELECLQVIIVSRSQSPSETFVRTTKSRRLLHQAEQIGRHENIPVHTQIRLAHDLPEAILETIKERHISLILMGWKGESSTPDRVFGNVVDTIIQKATCEVVLVKWGRRHQKPKIFATSRDEKMITFMEWQKWLVPIRSDLQKSAAIQLLPALVSPSFQPDVKLCQVANQPFCNEVNLGEINQGAEILSRRLHTSVTPVFICAKSVPEAIIDMAEKERCDVVVLGASREGLLKQVIQGNIPEAIAKGCSCTVILVRS